MKICFIAPASNYHTQKWCKWFCERGHEIHVISFTEAKIPNTIVHYIDCDVDTDSADSSKLKYLLYSRKVKKIVDDIKPDIVNVHYATSYGTVAALSGIKRYILSVWGSDIYDFPRKSVFHKQMLKYSLSKATEIFSTSKVMAEEAAKYTNKRIEITPFGVDMELFNPNKRTRLKGEAPYIIGIVKSLTDLYGIDVLLHAVAILRTNRSDIEISVRIAGDGPEKAKYETLAKELKIDDITHFLGYVSQEEAAQEWANMDVAVIPSRLYESFGVSAIEAEACGTPLIVSDVMGLLETTMVNSTSVAVPKGDPKAISDALAELYDCPQKREKMGLLGRQYVVEKYDLEKCFCHIEGLMTECMRGGG